MYCPARSETRDRYVEREIRLWRKFKVEEVLLLSREVSIPALYESRRRKEKEYMRFDESTPAPDFAETIVARRKMIEG